jgi:hypothetical protein
MRSIRIPEQGLISKGMGTETSWIPLTKSSLYHAKNFKLYANWVQINYKGKYSYCMQLLFKYNHSKLFPTEIKL